MSSETTKNPMPAPTADNFLAQRPLPAGLSRFLARKGINSPEEFINLMRYAPRIRWRRPR
jgi:hypothetical protein